MKLRILSFMACLTMAIMTINAKNINAADFGFLPTASALDNQKALQKAVDNGGTIEVTTPGVYELGGTVYVGSNTNIIFSNNVKIKKVAANGAYTHVFLNKGALTKTYDENITIEGLNIIVNGVDKSRTEIYGLRGQLAFFYIKDLLVKRFRCNDLGTQQFGIHICTFENIIVEDAIIRGKKDGVHLGRGKRFVIRDCTFQTKDDAIALNAHDYATSNPELGYIEDGVIENCHDLVDNEPKVVGYFCRILGGAWKDWTPGMKVRNSDTVVSNGRVYRVQAKADGTVYESKTRPTHESGSMELDGIKWGVVQNDVTYSAGVKNVVFRDIFLYKPRVGFSVHFDNDNYSRSYYPGSIIPTQHNISMHNVQVLYEEKQNLMLIGTPIDLVSMHNCKLNNSTISFIGKKEILSNYLDTHLSMVGCSFFAQEPLKLVSVTGGVCGKTITFSTIGSNIMNEGFKATTSYGGSKLIIKSDLPGLNGNNQ